MVEYARCKGSHNEITPRKGLFNFTQSKVKPSEGEHSFKMYPLSLQVVFIIKKRVSRN